MTYLRRRKRGLRNSMWTSISQILKRRKSGRIGLGPSVRSKKLPMAVFLKLLPVRRLLLKLRKWPKGPNDLGHLFPKVWLTHKKKKSAKIVRLDFHQSPLLKAKQRQKLLRFPSLLL